MTSALPIQHQRTLDAFIGLCGKREWRKRVAALGSVAQPGSLSGRAAQQRHALELALARLLEGRGGLGEGEKRLCGFAREAVQLAATLPAGPRDRLRARLQAGLTGEGTLIPLFHTLRTAALLRERGFAVAFTGLAEENLQARVRGMTLMGISNEEGHLVLTTGNKSELSVGYSTLYGDSAGGFGPIKDVSKVLVWELARWRNAIADERGQTSPIPPSSIDKPPSAELRPGQVDSDSLPDYAVLDAILEGYVSGDKGAADLVAEGFDRALVERVLRMTDAAEYKRRQFPPGTKISLRAFGRDRRLPITNTWRESAG